MTKRSTNFNKFSQDSKVVHVGRIVGLALGLGS